jgi:ABC-type sugar transport system ATPase subunit
MENIIEFNNITKEFPGVLALDNVTLSIEHGKIYTIVGENGAGKSTLMKILSGLYPPDCGDIIYKGEPIQIKDPMHALSFGISTVYQELQLCGNMKVVENIFMGKELRSKKGFLDWARMEEITTKLLSDFKMEIDPKEILKKLTVAQRQIVEIARAINQEIDVLILDEPTSSLTHAETEILFDNLRKLKEQGVTIIFISHRLDEIFEITDKISVLRDGVFLGTFDVTNLTPEDVVQLIAGKELAEELKNMANEEKIEHKGILLSVKCLSRKNHFQNVSFDLHKNEILGFYGLQGAGRTEVLETIFGLYKADSGEIFLEDEKIEFKSPIESINRGFSLIPEDRRQDGIFGNMDIEENIGVIHDKEISRMGFLNKKKLKAITKEYVKKFSIKISGHDQLISKLSGGNQQKVIISRCLSRNPDIIFMDEPTKGIDIGAKTEIYRIMKKLQAQGKAIILISSELQEIVSECERVIVMRNGYIAGELKHTDVNKENILQLAFNG